MLPSKKKFNLSFFFFILAAPPILTIILLSPQANASSTAQILAAISIVIASIICATHLVKTTSSLSPKANAILWVTTVITCVFGILSIIIGGCLAILSNSYWG